MAQNHRTMFILDAHFSKIVILELVFYQTTPSPLLLNT